MLLILVIIESIYCIYLESNTWPEARPLAVTSARKPTKLAPKQPISLRSQDSQTDNTTPKQPTPVINQSSQTHDTLTLEQPTSLKWNASYFWKKIYYG